MKTQKQVKPNYIYRLMITGKDYTDLASVAEDIMQDIADTYGEYRASKPHFFKTRNGYTAVVVLYNGKTIKRSIDVFKPIERKSNKKVVIDQCSRTLSPSYQECEWEEEDDGETYSWEE
jgi:hypothetical protein